MIIKRVRKKKGKMLAPGKIYLIFKLYSLNKKSVNSIFFKLNVSSCYELFMGKDSSLYLFIDFSNSLYYKKFIMQYLMKENIYFNLIGVKLNNNYLAPFLFKNYKEIGDSAHFYKFLLFFVYSSSVHNIINYIKFFFFITYAIYLNFNIVFFNILCQLSDKQHLG